VSSAWSTESNTTLELIRMLVRERFDPPVVRDSKAIGPGPSCPDGGTRKAGITSGVCLLDTPAQYTYW